MDPPILGAFFAAPNEQLVYPAIDSGEAAANNDNASIPRLPNGANPVAPGPQLINISRSGSSPFCGVGYAPKATVD